MIGLTVLPGDHAHHLAPLDLRLEGAAHPAIGAGGHHGALRLAQLDDGLLHEGRGRAGLDAGPTGDALGIHEGLLLASAHMGVEAASGDGQRKGALNLGAGAHAAAADDALGGVEAEIGVGLVLGAGALGIEVIRPVHPVADLPQAHHPGHVL